jgi:ubiquinone/menaquinone biosynthesis C-methylase UbiE
VFEHELRFALAMNWLAEEFEAGGCPEDLAAIKHALDLGADNAEGVPIPPFITSTHSDLPAILSLPCSSGMPISADQLAGKSTSHVQVDAFEIEIPNYIEAALHEEPALDRSLRTEAALDTFLRIWRSLLVREQPARCSVVEPACGSANDYRFFESSGLSTFLDYTGFDLCEKNVRNAKRMFPNARFEVANVFAIPSASGAFDCCVVHDLFEHLSIAGFEKAFEEICRVTRRKLCLGFFSMHEGGEHIVRPVDEYYVNTLSVPLVRDMLVSSGFDVQILHIGTFVKRKFACERTHNMNAYSLIAERRPPT